MTKHTAFATVFVALSLAASVALSSEGRAPGAIADRAESGASALSSHDKDFVREAAVGELVAVKLGELALTKSESADVKKFAQRMVDDHTTANTKLADIAQRKGINVPQQLDKKRQATYDKLSKKAGADFDKEYMSEMVDDHRKDVREFEKAAKDAKDADLKTFAQTTLPTLREHLTHAQQVHKAVHDQAKAKR